MSAPYPWIEIARPVPAFATRSMFSAGGMSDVQLPRPAVSQPASTSQSPPASSATW